MNDRVSNKPPSPYLEDEDEFLSQYDAGVGSRGSVLSSRADSNRNSIFRFGKSLAASFNPTNWKIWSKEKHAEQDEEAVQSRALKERQEKAERIYRELKESGRFRDAAHISQNVYQPTQPSLDKKSSGKHDSGIEFGENESNPRYSKEMTREDKRMGRVYLDPPLFQQPTRGYSPASNVSGSVARSDTSSPSKQSFTFKKGTLSNINGHFKKPSLSNIKKSFLGESRESLSYSSTTDLHRQARRIPSRKDLQKQQKLVKRVSDLEGKLEAARRQLSAAIGEPVPPLPADPVERFTRPRFVPGALASLPSERLLSGYVDPDENSLENPMGIDAPTMPETLGVPLLRTETLSKDVALPSVETEPEIKDGQETFDKQVSRDVLIIEAPTNISEPATQASDVKGADHKGKSNFELSEVSDKEATPKPPRARISRTPSKKRKIADDSGIYKPSGDDYESDLDPEIKKMTPKPLQQNARPTKLQKTATTPDSKGHSPQNQRVSASRIRARTSGTSITAPSRGNSMNGITSTLASSPPARKLSKVQPSQKDPQQSVHSPPSSPTFMGMKYEKQATANPRSGSRAAPSTNVRINPANLVYSADPNNESDIPPMPPLPKTIVLSSGEVLSTAGSAAVPKLVPGHNKLSKSKSSSPKKSDNQDKEQKSGGRMGPDGIWEWPEDCF